MSEQLGRRRFLKMAGISAGTVGAAAAFSQPGKFFDAVHDQPLSSAGHVIAQQAGETADDMDKMHEAGHHTTFAGLYVVQPEFSSPIDSIYKRGLCL